MCWSIEGRNSEKGNAGNAWLGRLEGRNQETAFLGGHVYSEQEEMVRAGAKALRVGET